MMKLRARRLTGCLLVLVCMLAGCEQRKEPARKETPQLPVFTGTVVCVGDSLTAGLGVNEEKAYPAQLEHKLRSAGLNWRVVNAGISGETSSGTLSRIDWVLKLKPDIVVLETGANDGLRGTDPAITRKNLDRIIQVLLKNDVIVVLAGMRMVANLGPDYTSAFAAVYPELANTYGLLLVPFFLEDVAGEPSLNQADGIHPNAEGYRIITNTIYPVVKQAIDRKGKR